MNSRAAARGAASETVASAVRSAPVAQHTNDDEALRLLRAFVARVAAARDEARRKDKHFVADLTMWHRSSGSYSFHSLHVDVVGVDAEVIARVIDYVPRAGTDVAFFARVLVPVIAAHFPVAVALYGWTPTDAAWGPAWEAGTPAELRHQCPREASGWVGVPRA